MIDLTAEKNFETKVKKYLESQECWFVKFFANRMTRKGIPDVLACVNGFFVGIELKSTAGKPTDLQIYNRNKIRRCGGISIVLYPEQFEDFKLMIEDLKTYPQHIDTIRTEQQTFDKERR